MTTRNQSVRHADQDKRFAFGRNWKSFLATLDERRIEEARSRLRESLGRDDLLGIRALDVGSGSGLSSLVMHQMGAEVVSFDYDADSVVCTETLRKRYALTGAKWEVSRGSALDPVFMAELGQFDLVYSWGVLHHTGAMWPALELTAKRTAPGGTLLIALYNDQGWRSSAWRQVKRLYCSGAAGRLMIGAIFYPLFSAYALWQDLRHLHVPGTHAREYAKKRGMSLFHDWRDWLGGYPFEVAKPEEVVRKLTAGGFELQRQSLTRGLGCNEFVFVRGSKTREGYGARSNSRNTRDTFRPTTVS